MAGEDRGTEPEEPDDVCKVLGGEPVSPGDLGKAQDPLHLFDDPGGGDQGPFPRTPRFQNLKRRALG
jgi:hypothetical protein